MTYTKQPPCALMWMRPDIDIPTAPWAESRVYFSQRIPTARRGPWRRDAVAALCRPGGPVEALDDRAVETVVVAKGSQIALTTTAYVWLAKCLKEDPSSALIVMASAQDARDKSGETWRPMWEDSPALRDALPANQRKDWTKLYQLINGAPCYWIGANSAGRLASKPIMRLILDEVDKYPQAFGDAKAKREAGAAALAKQRTKTFKQSGQAKIVEFSTPTLDTGEIWTAYLEGDQRHLYVKCPKCNGEQVMIWQGFKKDDTADGLHYECMHCKASWNDQDRWAAIDGGEWRATAEARDPRCRSYWIPSWCSKFISHAYLRQQWDKAQQGVGPLQDFINSECGQPFMHYDNAIKDEAFVGLEGDYSEGQRFAGCPAYSEQYEGRGAGETYCGVDVQQRYLVAVFRHFMPGGDSGLVWAGDCQNLEALAAKVKELSPTFVLIDQRYRTREVQEWCYRHTGWIPCQGTTARARTVFSLGSLDLDEGRSTRTGQRVIQLISHDPDALKDMLAECIQRRDGARRWLIPRGYAGNVAYTSQLKAERNVNGRWINPARKANHYWDAEVLALLGAVASGIWAGESPPSAAASSDAPKWETVTGGWEVRKA